MPSLRELVRKPELLSGGHRLCPGCGAPILVRLALRCTDSNIVTAVATGCLEVSTTTFPYTAWRCSFIHNAFENAAATLSGVETAYRALRKKGKVKGDFKFIAFGGDGGTYDIGLQSLSGVLERGHDMVYICYDNGAYMNTGIQRSGSTPLGANTTTSPVGKVHKGKEQSQKDLTAIAAAHNIPYAAQASVGHWRDLVNKIEKALNVEGPAFINVLSPCPRGWRYPASKTIEIAKLAVDTCCWPLYEVENGVWKINYKPKEKLPVEAWLKPQGRFRHVFEPENEWLLRSIQEEVDRRWEALLKKAGEA